MGFADLRLGLVVALRGELAVSLRGAEFRFVERQASGRLAIGTLHRRQRVSGARPAWLPAPASQLLGDHLRVAERCPTLPAVAAATWRALNILDAPMFLLDSRVRDWMDPSQPALKGTEGHHLFQRDYQEKVLCITDIKRIKQAGNFSPTDWSTHIAISNKPPMEYWPALVESRARDSAWLDRKMYCHALPDGWDLMDHEDFLTARRSLMAQVTRDAYNKLAGGHAEPVEPAAPAPERLEELVLRDLVERELLQPGDLLDPVDPEWEFDAVISEDRTLVIDVMHQFDSLDEAAHHLRVTNLSGLAFWALEAGEDLNPLRELITEGRPAIAVPVPTG